jgi:DNA-binding NarL/FixJ family response regulator
MQSVGGVLVGHPHQRLSEGLRDWLQASFAGVFIVADRSSLLDGAHKLQPALVIVDRTLAAGDVGSMLDELHRGAPTSRILLISGSQVSDADLAALSPGRDGIVHTDALVHDLSAAVDAVLTGRDFAAPAATDPAANADS